LDMTTDEAQFLADVLSYIGGTPERSRRGLAANLSLRLTQQGFRYTDCSYTNRSRDCAGSIVFEENTASLDWCKLCKMYGCGCEGKP